MNEQAERTRLKSDCGGRILIDDLGHGLHFAEMIAAANGSKRTGTGIHVRIFLPEAFLREAGCRIAVPWSLKRCEAFGCLVETKPTLWQIKRPELHPASDVCADDVRMQDAFGLGGAADRTMMTWMQIRHSRHGAHAGTIGEMLELPHGSILDPRLGRGKEVDAR
jgi:hypothetical protein